MEPTELTIFGLVAWSLILVVAIAASRATERLATGTPLNKFPVFGTPGSLTERVCRAHANCYEHLPFALALLLYAVATDTTAVTNGLALVFLGARVLQSLTHIASTSVPAVYIRFVFLLAQVAIVVVWLIGLVGAASA